MPNRGGRKAGAGNYSEDESRNLLQILEELRPIGPDEWLEACSKHNDKYPGRDVKSIRRKFATWHRRTIPTGDPDCPWYVREAKRIKYLIGEKAELGDGEDVYNIETGEFQSSATNTQQLGEIPQQTNQTQQQSQTQQQTQTQQQFGTGPQLGQPSQLTLDDSQEELLTEVTTVATATTVATTVATSVPGSFSTPTRLSGQQRASSPAASTTPSSSSKRSYRTTRSSPEDQAVLDVMKAFVEESRASREEAQAAREQAREEAKADRHMLMEAFRLSLSQSRSRKKRRVTTTSTSSSDSE